MTSAKITGIEVVEKAAQPTLLFRVTIELHDKEVPLSVGGAVLVGETLIAPLFEGTSDATHELELDVGEGLGRGQQNRCAHLHLLASLNPQALDHIENFRAQQGPKGDVFFKLRINVRFLGSVAGGTKVEGLAHSGITTDNRGRFLVQKTINLRDELRVPGADWVHDIAPKLGLGRFMTIELPHPSTLPGGEFGERMQKAIASLASAEKSIVASDWPQVFADLRGVWESLRDHADVKDALLIDGYPASAAAEINAALKSFFDVSSKFVHALGKDKTVLPEIVARKEDAYLVYCSAMAAINLIARKMHRHRTW